MRKAVFLLFLAMSTVVFADQAKDIEKVKAELAKVINAKQAEVKPSPAKGVYQVSVQGNLVFAYVDDDHVLIGDLFNTKTKANVGDQITAQIMSEKIKEVPLSKMIVFGDKADKRFITVFTDIDCGYCRKLHNEVTALNEAGIQVRYLAFPRAGLESDSYKKYVSVWCNDDQQTSLTNAKMGKPVAEATCDNPIAESYKLGQSVGVRGTPTIIMDNGTLLPGYVPAKQLIQQMGIKG